MPKTKRRRLTVSPAVALGALGVMFVLLYAGITAFPLIEGPSVTVQAPTDTEHGTVVLSGETSRVSKLTLNDLEIAITETGAFSVERAYPSGYTVVVLKASDRFGRTREEIITFTTKEKHYASQEESEAGDVGVLSEDDENGLN